MSWLLTADNRKQLLHFLFTDLTSHIKIQHQQTLPFECDVCHLKLTTKTGLQRHAASVHLNDKKFKCGTCKLKFAVVHTRDIHVREVHNKVKGNECFVCLKKFSRAHSLRYFFVLWHDGLTFDMVGSRLRSPGFDSCFHQMGVISP